ncbi:MAG TPA: DUF5336 domain-containing protein [Mycobacterium sp.]|nr:DUF5336 domain-containing protein [Mycobacterium sp.]
MTPSGRPDAESRLPGGLFIAVAVLGLATYALSFGPVVDGAGATGWYVRFAALAGLSAGLGLLPGQTPHTLVTAALAAMGFLDALSSRLLDTAPGWALTVIVALNAVQTAVAVAALLLSPKGRADDAVAAGYESYVEYYNQAVRNYYGQQAHTAPPQQAQRGGYAQGSAGVQASAPQTQRAQRASQYGDYADFVSPQGDYGRSVSAASSAAAQSQTVPPGGPSVRPAQPPADRQEDEADQSAWPPSQ